MPRFTVVYYMIEQVYVHMKAKILPFTSPNASIVDSPLVILNDKAVVND